MGIGEDPAVTEDDTGAALARPDADDGRPGGVRHGGDGGLEVVDGAHSGCISWCRLRDY
jgi:hypothetical protein